MRHDEPKPNSRPGKVRHCWNCGANMGFIENRWYDSRDTCGSPECEREARDAWEAERDAEIDRVNDRFDGGW